MALGNGLDILYSILVYIEGCTSYEPPSVAGARCSIHGLRLPKTPGLPGKLGKRLVDSLLILNAFLCGCGHHRGDHSTPRALSVAVGGFPSHCVTSDIQRTIAGDGGI